MVRTTDEIINKIKKGKCSPMAYAYYPDKCVFISAGSLKGEKPTELICWSCKEIVRATKNCFKHVNKAPKACEGSSNARAQRNYEKKVEQFDIGPPIFNIQGTYSKSPIANNTRSGYGSSRSPNDYDILADKICQSDTRWVIRSRTLIFNNKKMTFNDILREPEEIKGGDCQIMYFEIKSIKFRDKGGFYLNKDSAACSGSVSIGAELVDSFVRKYGDPNNLKGKYIACLVDPNNFKHRCVKINDKGEMKNLGLSEMFSPLNYGA